MNITRARDRRKATVLLEKTTSISERRQRERWRRWTWKKLTRQARSERRREKRRKGDRSGKGSIKEKKTPKREAKGEGEKAITPIEGTSWRVNFPESEQLSCRSGLALELAKTKVKSSFIGEGGGGREK